MQDLSRPAVGSSASLRRGLRVVAVGIRQEPRWFALAVLGSAVYAVMTTGMAWAVGEVTNDVITPAVAARSVSAGDLARIFLTILGVVLLLVVGIIGRRVAGGITMYNLGARYRREVTRQYLRLPLAWHHRHPSGQLLSNANADVEATWNVFGPLPMAIGVVIMLVIGVAQMLLVDPVLALIAVLVFPALFAVNLLFQRAMSPRVMRAQRLRAEVSEVAHESFEAALVVKSLGREDDEAQRFTAATNALREANIEVGTTRGTFDPVIDAIPQLGTLAVLVAGTWRVHSGAIGAGEVVQVAYLFSLLAFPVRALGWVLAELPRAVVGWDRVDHVLQATGEMTYGDEVAARGRASALRVERVSYAYELAGEPGADGAADPSGGQASAGGTVSPGASREAIHEATLDLPPGRTVALVGPTGAGKTTLANLVVRLVDPDSGRVTLDGVELPRLRHGEIPQVAALVPQQTFMFDDTVRGNITLGLARSDAQVWAALEVAQGADFVAGLPQGLDTRVGERGASLSGGQRQRVALARAVVRAPQLLVLDDATSAVDPAVEQRILARLRDTAAGTTVLVVAYRMATIALADEVVFLDDGRVLDHGSHAELLGRCPGYAELVTAYARDAEARAQAGPDEASGSGGSDSSTGSGGSDAASTTAEVSA